MKKPLLFILLVICSVGFVQANYTGNINYTIKTGPAANQVQVFANFTTAFSGKIPQFEFVIGYQTSSISATAPTMLYTVDPTFNAMFGSPYSFVTGTSTSSSPVGYTYNDFSGNLSSGSSDATIAGGTEISIGTVTFSGGSNSMPVYLLDFADGGNDGAGVTYFSLTSGGNAAGNFGPSYGGNSVFYSAANGSSTASTSAGNSYVVTNSTLSLPVTLVYFTAAPLSGKVNLTWATATETNSSFFMVERSADASSFSTVAVVPAVGFGANCYAAVDGAPLTGMSFYRLKNIDKDGSFAYSSIIKVDNNTNSSNGVSVYPSPAQSALNVVVNKTSLHNTPASLIDLGGHVLKMFTVVSTDQKIDVSNLTAGIYFIRLSDGSGISFMKQ